MTEAEWVTARDPRSMLRHLWSPEREGNPENDRRFRLFVVACCCDGPRVLWKGVASSEAVSVALRFADGSASEEELRLAQDAVRQQLERVAEVYPGEPIWDPTWYTCSADLAVDARSASWYASIRGYLQGAGKESAEEVQDESNKGLRVQVEFLRDIFGNPFRPVTFPESWRTEHTVGLVAKMYDERDFAAMPILADALEEARCDNADILTHCREPGVHVRGCWVVDLVLGKV